MKRAPRGAAPAGGRGFTLVELAVVFAMIGILAALAVVFVKPRSYVATARGYADEIAALCDAVRQRAVASRTQQRIEVEGDQVIHSQARSSDLDAPPEWDPVGKVPVPSQVVIASVDYSAHVQSNQSVPTAGANLPAEIVFRADGSADRAATIFVEDARQENRARVVLYPATGSAYTYHEW